MQIYRPHAITQGRRSTQPPIQHKATCVDHNHINLHLHLPIHAAYGEIQLNAVVAVAPSPKALMSAEIAE